MSSETSQGPKSHSALLICDIWDAHYCTSAAAGTERLAQMVDRVAGEFRSRGGQVIHSPSETMPYYGDHPARTWVTELPRATVPATRPVADPPIPEPVSICPDVPTCVPGPPWPHTRENAAIEIDPSDAVLDSGEDLLAVIDARGIGHIYMAGVHTNMCILKRPFGIRQLVRWGISCSLARELTEAMPADFTPAVCRYIEDNWCPTVSTVELLNGAY